MKYKTKIDIFVTIVIFFIVFPSWIILLFYLLNSLNPPQWIWAMFGIYTIGTFIGKVVIALQPKET